MCLDDKSNAKDVARTLAILKAKAKRANANECNSASTNVTLAIIVLGTSTR